MEPPREKEPPPPRGIELPRLRETAPRGCEGEEPPDRAGDLVTLGARFPRLTPLPGEVEPEPRLERERDPW